MESGNGQDLHNQIVLLKPAAESLDGAFIVQCFSPTSGLVNERYQVQHLLRRQAR